MANFERLIRGAIAAKKASTVDERREIYNSSRNALKRLIEENRSMTVEHAIAEQSALENAITRIEDSFTPPPPPVHQESEGDPFAELKEIIFEGREEPPRPGVVSPDAPQLDASPSVENPAPARPGNPEMAAPPAAQPDLEPEVSPPAVSDPAAELPEVAPEAYDERTNMPLEFARRRKLQKRFAWIAGALLVMALLGWLGYIILTAIADGSLFASNGAGSADRSPATSSSSNEADYITILEPGDLSSLVTANRGEAQIVNELNFEMVRLVSVRDPANPSSPADPILLRLQPGVLKQISGKNVTFEIYAKSGASGPAQFTVKCQFGELGSCGRKRFRVGLQPEASIFAFDFARVQDLEQEAYIAISTDTTSSAATTGRGDAVDIVYARMRAN